MGADIYAFVEVYNGKEWKPAIEPEPYLYNDYEVHYDQLGYHFNPPEIIYEPEYFDLDRNSSFFNAIGGGSSNYDMEELAYNRGLPLDMNLLTSDYVLRYQKDADHTYSYSWVTLAEILNIGWNKKWTKENGYVKNEQVHLVSDGNQQFPSELSYEDVKWYCSPGLDLNLYSKVTWLITYAKAIGEDYLQDVIDRLSVYGDPDKERMIFWYG